ncbi:hypothetical protein RCO25_18620 [Paenibacillus sp. LHD-38]|nr:hypothetical protein [Paenibacillus sp. LHD-38]MDQ8736491.1 hypothetical protein [Paenibacillus sp. LHD-38]
MGRGRSASYRRYGAGPALRVADGRTDDGRAAGAYGVGALPDRGRA